MKTVFILGAGASHEAGAPLMSNFFDHAHDLLRRKTSGVIEVKKEFDEIFEAIAELHRVHSKSYLDLDNIEIVFGAIEMALLLEKFGERDIEEIKKLKKSLVTLIYRTLEFSIPFKIVRNRPEPPKPYGLFCNMLKNINNQRGVSADPHEFSFITFNYDLCLDYALTFNHWNFDYYLEKKEKTNPKATPLLKLHNSINWGSTNNNQIIPYPLNEFGLQYDWLGTRGPVFFDLGSKLKSRKCQEGKPFNELPVIVPPTWNKTAYQSQLTNVWSAASKVLSEAENIFVIGYSLPETDSFFRYLYALGTESNTRIRNFVVIDPDSTESVKKRFLALIGKGIENRFQFKQLTFDDGIPKIEEILCKL